MKISTLINFNLIFAILEYQAAGIHGDPAVTLKERWMNSLECLRGSICRPCHSARTHTCAPVGAHACGVRWQFDLQTPVWIQPGGSSLGDATWGIQPGGPNRGDPAWRIEPGGCSLDSSLSRTTWANARFIQKHAHLRFSWTLSPCKREQELQMVED